MTDDSSREKGGAVKHILIPIFTAVLSFGAGAYLAPLLFYLDVLPGQCGWR